MKIALVNKTFSLSHGGGERFSVNLAKAMCRQGHEVHVFAQQVENLPEEITFHRVPCARKPSFLRVLSFAKRVRDMLAGETFDIVYGLTQIFPQDLHRMGGGIHRHWMQVRFPFAPWRWLNYLVNPTHLANLYLEFRIYQSGNFRRIVTNSELCKRHAQDYYGIPPERIAVIYNGVDHAAFNPEKAAACREKIRKEVGLKRDDVAILFVASNWKRKGLEVLLEAVAALGNKGRFFHVVVVGRGNPQPFRSLSVRLELESRVHFCGPCQDVGKYYGAGDLLVLPTLYDPFANVCLEGMACGLPVVTSAANGAAEIIRPGENGFVQQDPNSARELSLLLVPFLAGDQRRKMGWVARQTAMEFTTERNMAETVEVCRQVLEEKRA